ncbi:thioredoxin domain-containing protein [Citricoccus sp. SGAir0253]|uniref:thioredoxin domain-containing protein n=1 Tax=Citricoccus sp. SGAir0253 TaxID=2567881 RepID=UPI001FEDC240|nr:DUF255 domain-containing protein [Citricoccus sp. SGAir0253]
MDPTGNQLSDTTSPYLLQHAGNPVHWRPWGAEAFAEAARRDVPVFVSIGYAACHWCHVMAHESFEDQATAEELNEHFVAVKVDREEHPDVDDAYMTATQLLTGRGGWPMSVFTTPDGRPFHAGTYYPPTPRQVGGGDGAAHGGRVPSFREVLAAVFSAWSSRRAEVERAAAALAAEVGRQSGALAGIVLGAGSGAGTAAGRGDGTAAERGAQDGPASGAGEPPGADGPDGGPPDPLDLRPAGLAEPAEATAAPGAEAGPRRFGPALTGALARLAELEDEGHGGFGTRAPKFPPSPALGFLLQMASTGPAPERRAAWELASRTLATMGTSALADPLSGGFARYATDRDWALPHFEKMLYDNAQLLRWYARWAALPGLVDLEPVDPRHPGLGRRLALGTAAWLDGRMRTASGAFAASLDADTVVGDRPVEGATYTWTPFELGEALAAGAPEARAADVAHLAGVLAGVPVEAGGRELTLHAGRLLTDAEQRLWDRALPELRRRAAARPQPARDGKEVAAWNGMAVTALAEAWALLGEDSLLGSALAAGRALWRVHCRGLALPGGTPVGTPTAERGAAEQAAEAGGGGADTPADGTAGAAGPAVVLRSALDGRPGPAPGTLADHAHAAGAFLALYRATGDPDWKARARAVVEAVVATLVVDTDHGPALLASPAGDRALAAAQGGPAFASPLDGAEPSAVGSWAEVLLQWHVVSPGHAATLPAGGARAWAEGLLAHVDRLGPQAPVETGTALRLAARHAAVEDLLVATGGADDPAGERRRSLAWALVHGVVGVAGPAGSAPERTVPPDPDDVAAGRTSRDGGPALYLCHGTLCHAPVGTTAALDRLAGLSPGRG